MNSTLTNKYKEISDFLRAYREIWSTEVIYDADNHFSHYPEEWLNKIDTFSIEDLFVLNSRSDLIKSLPLSMSNLLSDLTHLSQIPTLLDQDEWQTLSPQLCLPPPAMQNLVPKKVHEIETSIAFLRLQKVIPDELPVIDFCGGAAYFGRTLAYFLDTPSISLDKDKELQERGFRRSQNFTPRNCKEIEFINEDLLADYSNLKTKIPSQRAFIGMHTCGHLSDIQLRLSRDLNAPWTFNIGCCYFKTDDYQYRLSSTANEFPIEYTANSLFLAARGNEVKLNDFIVSFKVKEFRFLLHLFLNSEFGLPFIPVGSVPMREYKSDFNSYAMGRLENLYKHGTIPHLPDVNLVKTFSAQSDVTTLTKKMISCNYIRSQFSRILEVSIALDRAIFLEESDFKVSLGELFNSKISPRNICLFGKRD